MKNRTHIEFPRRIILHCKYGKKVNCFILSIILPNPRDTLTGFILKDLWIMKDRQIQKEEVSADEDLILQFQYKSIMSNTFTYSFKVYYLLFRNVNLRSLLNCGFANQGRRINQRQAVELPIFSCFFPAYIKFTARIQS